MANFQEWRLRHYAYVPKSRITSINIRKYSIFKVQKFIFNHSQMHWVRLERVKTYVTTTDFWPDEKRWKNLCFAQKSECSFRMDSLIFGSSGFSPSIRYWNCSSEVLQLPVLSWARSGIRLLSVCTEAGIHLPSKADLWSGRIFFRRKEKEFLFQKDSDGICHRWSWTVRQCLSADQHIRRRVQPCGFLLHR